AGRRTALVVLVLVTAFAGGAVLLALSRAAWLALACVLGVLLAAWCCRSPLRGLALLAGLVLVGLGTLGLICCFAEGDGVLGALAERLRHLGDAASRLHIWHAGLAMFREHPLFGCGLDAFQLAFTPLRTLAYTQVEFDRTPGRAHNEAIHILATQGLLGG